MSIGSFKPTIVVSRVDGDGLGVGNGMSMAVGVRAPVGDGVPVGGNAEEKGAGADGICAGAPGQFDAGCELVLVSGERFETVSTVAGITVPGGLGTSVGASANSGVLSSIS